MGSLQRFNLKKYIKAYDLSVLFETGTYKGDGVKYALESGFERVFSTEIMDEYVELNREQFRQNENVTVLKGNSSDLLDAHLSEIKGNIFFWLDAHFPGADGGLLDYNSDFEDAVKYPLEGELKIIKKHRPTEEDVILMDDLRMYEEGPFQQGNLPENIKRPANSSVDFVYRLYADSHHIEKLYEDQGYLLLLPKTRNSRVYMNLGFREKIKKILHAG